ncbi:MAG: chorismate synthase [Clostridia bacterium]|nr:chorismate synthase [Clostridia bacterium]
MATTYGQNLKITIYGGSHDAEIGVIAEGLPVGFEINLPELETFMQRRAPGKNAYSTTRREADAPVFLSGVTDGSLDGSTLRAVIYNTNQRSSDYSNLAFIPRPSHADFAARMKYGEEVDLRGGGHFSGRLTAPMCIVGGICLQYLASRGIYVGAHLYCIENVYDTPFDMVSLDKNTLLAPKSSEFPVLNEEAGENMKKAIENARLDADSVGGIVECGVIGLPAGLGEHMFCGVENRISGIVFGIPAVKGIEFGNGFECAHIRGSQNNDPFRTDGKRIYTETNNAGGILGGMTSGMPLIFRAAMKPTPSIYKEQDSVDMVSMTNQRLLIKGRHDPCVAVRAVPVFEAAAAIAITDMLLAENK